MVAPWIGTLLGFLSGMGTGGGSLLILWLTLGLSWDSETARLVNLMFFIPSALVACYFRRKQGRLSLSKVLPGIVAACISAFVFSMLFETANPQWLKKFFGILLLFTGARELFYREQKRR